MNWPDAIYKSVRLICLTLLVVQIVTLGNQLWRLQLYLELAKDARKPSIEITPDFRAEPKLREEKLRCNPKRERSKKGFVKRIDGFSVVVQLDWQKQRRSYHHAFFNPVVGPKLF